MIKKHWPILFAIAAVVISIILGIVASNSSDTGVAILVGVIIFMFLFPLTGALIGGWYGWRTRSPLKWIAAPAVYLGAVLYLVAADLMSGIGLTDLGSCLSVGSFTGIAALGVEAATSVIAWLARRNKKTE
ncbi:MAG: hypothetical protein K6B42_04815 [Clostridia bacterium]|nr:hypothetical protein [Clostridia bacterium]